jgi:hypothetical protein
MAATDARPVPRKNIAYRVTFPILDADGDLVTGAASLDSEVSIDGGTFADVTAEATEIATASGVYFLDLTAAEMNGDTIAVIVKTATAGAKTTTIVMYPEEAGDYRADVVQWNGSAVATPTVAGVPEVDVTHWIGTAAATPTVAGVPEIDVTHYGGTAGTFAAGRPEVNTTHWRGTAAAVPTVAGVPAVETIDISAAGQTDIRSAVGLAAANLDTQLDALPTAAENADAAWDEDATAHQTLGTFGQAIGDPVADTNTIYKAVVTDAAGATVGVDVVAVQADTDNIQTRLPAALVGGRMDSDVAVMQANTLTASALAADAATEIRSLASGTADSGSTTTMVDAARTEADTDYWKGAIIVFTSGTLLGQARLITAFNFTTDTITFEPATTIAVGTHTYEIWPGAAVNVRQWLETTVATPDTAGHPKVTIKDGAGVGEINTNAGKVVGVELVDTLTTYTGNTPQTGDSFARLGAPAGASVSVDIAAIEAQTDDIGVAGAGLTAIPSIPTVTGSVGSVVGLTAATVHADLDDIQARLPAALVSGRMSSDTVAISGSTESADRIERSTLSIVTGTVGVGSTTTSIVASATSPVSGVNDQFKGRIMNFDKDTTTVALRGQSTDITAYTHATTTFTCTALTTAPASGDLFSIT